MAVNEEARQLDVASELEEAARTLAHSTRAVPKPFESYRLLGELSATADHLAQVLAQLATWHAATQDGTHYDGEDGGRTGSPQAAADELHAAARAVTEASEHIGRAHAHNGVVRWYETELREATAKR